MGKKTNELEEPRTSFVKNCLLLHIVALAAVMYDVKCFMSNTFNFLTVQVLQCDSTSMQKISDIDCFRPQVIQDIRCLD